MGSSHKYTHTPTGGLFLPAGNSSGTYQNTSIVANTTRTRKPCSSVFPTTIHASKPPMVTVTVTVTVDPVTSAKPPSVSVEAEVFTTSETFSRRLPYSSGAPFTNSTDVAGATNTEAILFSTGITSHYDKPIGTAPVLAPLPIVSSSTVPSISSIQITPTSAAASTPINIAEIPTTSAAPLHSTTLSTGRQPFTLSSSWIQNSTEIAKHLATGSVGTNLRVAVPSTMVTVVSAVSSSIATQPRL